MSITTFYKKSYTKPIKPDRMKRPWYERNKFWWLKGEGEFPKTGLLLNPDTEKGFVEACMMCKWLFKHYPAVAELTLTCIIRSVRDYSRKLEDDLLRQIKEWEEGRFEWLMQNGYLQEDPEQEQTDQHVETSSSQSDTWKDDIPF